MPHDQKTEIIWLTIGLYKWMLVFHLVKFGYYWTCRSEDRAIHIFHVTWKWWRHCHLQVKIIACCSTIFPSCFVLGLVQMDINSTFFVMWPRIDDTIATCKLRPLDASLIPCRVYRSYLSGDKSISNFYMTWVSEIWA